MAGEVAFFPTLADLLLALHLCDETGGLFPEEVLRTKALPMRFGVPVTPVRTRSEVTLLAERFQWQVTFSSRGPRDESVPLRDLVAGRWRDGQPGGQGALTSTPVADEHWLGEPEEVGRRYLLAVSSGRAQALLESLLDALADDVRAIPIDLDGVGHSPLAHFWEVEMERPRLPLLHAADRVWWGPVGAGKVEVFQEWPYEMAVPTTYIERIDFGADTQVALYSRTPSSVHLLRRSNGRVFADLIEVADLVASSPRMIDVPVAAPERSLAFKVDVRLVPERRRRPAERQVRDLELEIAAKEAMLERIRQHNDLAVDDLAPEPLYLYPQRRRERPPAELERLLVEWSDQADDLGSLRYAKVDAPELAAALGAEGADIHVLTTAAAISGATESGLGVRLRAYRPQRMANARYELLPEWAPFGLRLFVPTDEALELYPGLRPNALAATKLAQALGVDPPEEFAVLLVPGRSEIVRPAVIPLAVLAPLLGSFSWSCRFDPRLSLHATAERAEEVARRTVMEAIDEGFRQAAEDSINIRVNASARKLQQELERHVERLAANTEVVDEMEAELDRFVKSVADLSSAAGTLAKLDRRAAAKASSLNPVVADFKRTLSSLKRVRRQPTRQETKARKLATQLDAIGKRLGRARGRRA